MLRSLNKKTDLNGNMDGDIPDADLHLVPNSRSHKGSIHIGQQRSMNSRESGTQQADVQTNFAGTGWSNAKWFSILQFMQFLRWRM